MGVGNAEHRRLLLIVDGKGIFVAAGEGIALRRVDQRGRHAGNGMQPRLPAGQRRERLQQAPGVGVARIVKDILRRAELHDLPGVHDGHTIRHARHGAEIVGDETPSDLSSKIVSDLLRNKLGFTGVIITDSHQMASITDHYAPGEAAVKALQAGVDMILMPQDLQAAFDGVKQALSDGTLTQARIDESVLRILQVKAEYNILQ